MLIAPTEAQHAALRALGRISSQPERCGADFLFSAKATGTVGVQRKAFPGDFLASVDDGRLSKEVAQMGVLDVRVLIIEGRGTWTLDGQLVAKWGQAWTKDQHRAFLWSMRAAGVWVEWSDDVDDTARVIRGLERWARKAKHTALMRRPGAKTAWGRPTSKEFGCHILQAFEGIGPEQASRIYDHFGGVPLSWTVGEREMREVQGIGPKKAKQLYGALERVAEGEVA